MGFIKTGDSQPVDFFDHDGEPLSDEEVKKLADKPQAPQTITDDEETDERELND